MMTGEIDYANLYYPTREEITLKRNKSVFHPNDTLLFSNLDGADISTFPKSQYFPITAQMMVALLVLLLSIVIINLLLGIAVQDVQVFLSFLKHFEYLNYTL